MDERRTRIARNEATFRNSNYRIGDAASEAGRRSGSFFCECGRSDCRGHVELLLTDYHRIREHDRRLFVLPGHEVADVETVVERHPGFNVVEKPGEAGTTLDDVDAP